MINLSSKSYMQKYLRDLGWELGLAFCSTQLATQVPSPTSKKCCQVGIQVILGTWDLVWNAKSQLPCSQRLRLHGLTSSNLGLRTREPCEWAFKMSSQELLQTKGSDWTAILRNFKNLVLKPRQILAANNSFLDLWSTHYKDRLTIVHYIYIYIYSRGPHE
jgi:hypothetical protein